MGPLHGQLSDILEAGYQSTMGPGFKPVITSGIRTAAADKAVGGTGKGRHVTGNAIDIRSNDSVMSPAQGQEIANRLNTTMGPDYDVLQHGSGANRHIHMEYDPKGEQGDPFQATNKNMNITGNTGNIKDNSLAAMSGMKQFLSSTFIPMLANEITKAMQLTSNNNSQSHSIIALG